jgi:hypothetical protein
VKEEKYQVTASIVGYHNDIEEIKRAINSFLNTDLKVKLFISDNSEDEKLKTLQSEKVEYIKNKSNLGFGKAHNKIINKIKSNTEFHLILNPDVYFDKGVIEKLYKYMKNNSEVGLVMPKVLYPNGDIQYLCKKLPSPCHLVIRKFVPFKKLQNKINYKYEMRDKDYSIIMEVPNLSGAFMFVRSEVFDKVGIFDERYFMYMEDTDFVRRIGEKYKTVYYPKVYIYHEYKKGSYKNLKLMKYHISSAFKYFNKWGWIFDKRNNY